MERIENRLSAAGFKLLGIGQSIEQLILDILDTNDTRYLKAIPFFLYKYDVDIINIFNRTTNPDLFKKIIEITQEIFREFNIQKKLPEHIEFLGARTLQPRKNISLSYITPSLNDYEFRNEFEIQFRGENKQDLLIDRQKMDAERNLQFWLSQLFSKKEKIILKMISEEQPISKTDYEYYSRKIKKKLKAIIDLQEFARSLVEKKPHYDEGLFSFKKDLEKWLESKFTLEKVSIQKYSTIGEDSMYITFKQKEEDLSKDQIHNKIIKFTEIDNNQIRSLLEKYKQAEFV